MAAFIAARPPRALLSTMITLSLSVKVVAPSAATKSAVAPVVAARTPPLGDGVSRFLPRSSSRTFADGSCSISPKRAPAPPGPEPTMI
eukprot:scaffold21223_cov64-Phaeocystis_antarctica.AAC.1